MMHRHSARVGLRGCMRRAVYASLYILPLVVVLAAAAAAVEYDIIAGHGILDWDTNADGVADGWSFERTGKINGGIRLTSSGTVDGKPAEQLYFNTSVGRLGELRLFKEVQVGSGLLVAPGDTIHASAYLKRSVPSGGYVMADVACLDQARQPISVGYVLPRTTTSDSRWVVYKTDLTIAPGTAWLSINFRIGMQSGWGSGSLYVDQVVVTKDVNEVPTPPAGAIPSALVDNPGTDPVYSAKRYGAYVVRPSNYTFIRTFRAYHPEARVILSQLHGATLAQDDPVPSDPFGYAWINRYHREWFLLDAAKHKVTMPGNPNAYALDIGSASYQREWAQAAAKNAMATGSDGILIEGLRATLAWTGQQGPVKYPTDQSWLAAEDAFVRYVTGQIKNAKLLALGGGGNAAWNQPPWSQWVQILDGRQYESPCAGEVCTFETYDNWKMVLDSYRLFPNKVYIHLASHPTDDDTVMRDLASFLLGAGPDSHMGFRSIGGPHPRYHPFLDIAVGAPLGEPEEVGYRTFHRSYELGEVYVNADAASDATVQVPPGLQDVYGNAAPSGPRDIGPKQGLILLKGEPDPGGGGGGPGQQVPMDLLGGIGGFEYAGDTEWNTYAHPDYSFDSDSGWVSDYRSAFTLKSDVVRRIGGSGSGDQVTIRVVHSPDGAANERTYEFTDGGGAGAGLIEVNIGSDASPANAAAKLREVIDREQGGAGPGAVATEASGGVVYVRPNLHWEMTRFEDSDTSNGRVSSQFQSWRYGFDRSTPDDSVAVGWMRKSGSNINPGVHPLFRVADGGIGGSKCQYMAVRSFNDTKGGSVMLTSVFRVRAKPSNLHPGDSVTFALDSIRMSGYTGLAAGASVRYWVRVELGGGQIVEKTLSASGTGSADQIDAGPIPAGQSEVLATVGVTVSGNLSGNEVGIYLDGAHLYVKRAENPAAYATWLVPVSRDRAVSTFVFSYDWETDRHDIYDVARECDSVVLGEQYGKYAARLRYLNPSISVYTYESPVVTDYRDSRGVDPWYANSPLKLGWVLSNHPDWLYSDGQGWYATPIYYHMRLGNAECRALWAAGCREIAARWHFDGVFFDGPAPLDEFVSGGKLVTPSREPWEVQSFLHDAVPMVKSGGLGVAQNIAGYHLESAPGNVYMNPSWVPVAPYNTIEYTANTPGTVADRFFQEYAFFGVDNTGGGGIRNWYNKDYWKACLDDMDAVKRWNTSGGARKYYHVLVYGSDRADDPASGLDGWMRLGLASYLLGQNDSTTFSSGLRPTYASWADISVTKRLGAPSGEHAAYNGDQYMRYRMYAATTDGGVGGVVVVNGNHDVSRTYTVPFNVVDENGSPLAAGTVITLTPHTGRILLRS